MKPWVLSPVARKDLESILAFVDEQCGDFDTGDRVLADFEAAFALLAASPKMGRKRPSLTGSGFRWWPVNRYLILYDPQKSPLRVLRILHSARDLTRLLDAFR